MDFKAVALEYLDSDTGLVVISIVLMLVLALPILFTIAHACRAGGVFSRLWHVALFGWYIAFTMLDTVTTAIWTTRFLADRVRRVLRADGPDDQRAAGSRPQCRPRCICRRARYLLPRRRHVLHVLVLVPRVGAAVRAQSKSRAA